jgi:hypothetical protein
MNQRLWVEMLIYMLMFHLQGVLQHHRKSVLCGPIQVCICMQSVCIVLRLIVKDVILFVTVDSGKRAFRKCRTRSCPPKVNTIILHAVKVFQRMFQPMVVMLVWR